MPLSLTGKLLQKKIHSGLQVMGFSVIHEHQVGALPMHLDIVTKGQGKNGEQHTVAVEVDGPTHFVHTAAGPHSHNSATRFRNAALLLHNVHVRLKFMSQDPQLNITCLDSKAAQHTRREF